MEDFALDPSIPRKMFYKIGDVSEIFNVKPYVLRYWESEFKEIKPAKNRFGQRVYRQKDLIVLQRVKELLYKEKFTIAGAKKQLAFEKAARQKKAQEQPVNQKKIKETNSSEKDRNAYIHLLREQKGQLQEILKIIKTGIEIKTEKEVGA
ncbi:MAG: MerR family transcriptional regulator [bacterium]